MEIIRTRDEWVNNYLKVEDDCMMVFSSEYERSEPEKHLYALPHTRMLSYLKTGKWKK